ncbi:hypothetical protein B7463_g3303, partial [Scytalidium lignicola]
MDRTDSDPTTGSRRTGGWQKKPDTVPDSISRKRERDRRAQTVLREKRYAHIKSLETKLAFYEENQDERLKRLTNIAMKLYRENLMLRKQMSRIYSLISDIKSLGNFETCTFSAEELAILQDPQLTSLSDGKGTELPREAIETTIRRVEAKQDGASYSSITSFPGQNASTNCYIPFERDTEQIYHLNLDASSSSIFTPHLSNPISHSQPIARSTSENSGAMSYHPNDLPSASGYSSFYHPLSSDHINSTQLPQSTLLFTNPVLDGSSFDVAEKPFSDEDRLAESQCLEILDLACSGFLWVPVLETWAKVPPTVPSIYPRHEPLFDFLSDFDSEMISSFPEIPDPIDLLYGSRTNALANAFAQNVKRWCERDVERLAIGHLLYLYTKWRLSPTRERYERLPTWFCPTEDQLKDEHHIAFDQLVWPRIRGDFIKFGSGLSITVVEQILRLFATNLRVIWTDAPILERDPEEGGLRMRPDFYYTLIHEEGWALKSHCESEYYSLESGRGGGGVGVPQLQVPHSQSQSTSGSRVGSLEIGSLDTCFFANIEMGEVVLGVVSSGFAVASLAIQLVEASQKLYGLWDSFIEADSSIERIKDHLLVMQIISGSIIGICEDQPRLACGDAVLKSLQCCKARILKLEEVSHCKALGVEPNFMKKNWVNLKLALKDKTIEKIESQLGSNVMMLLLSLQPFFHHVHRHDVFSIKEAIASLSSPQKPPKSDNHQGAQFDMKNHSPNYQRTPTHGIRSTQMVQGRNKKLELFSRWRHHHSFFRLDSVAVIEKALSRLGFCVPATWRGTSRPYLFDILYTSLSSPQYYLAEQTLLVNIKRRLRVMLSVLSFQIQTSSLPISVTCYPVVPCEHQIFNLCVDGNFDAVRTLFETSRASPFAVNQHGENLLHAAARYAHAELCNYLLDIGVDGSAYDDRLLTPLDHLARKICMSFAFPSRVVNTIRALVEKGNCQPLLPLTSNAVAFYRGPEEGFAWLFASEYACVDLENRDSEGWTLLGEAAFNFGWWSQLGTDDPAIGWQALYLLRAGANPHATSSGSGLTPLDTFLRGCTRYQVEDARGWLQVLCQSGIDLGKYADEEQRIHGHEQYLKSTWDEDLWRWIPTKRRVVYKYGQSSDQLRIWIDDFDALSWFRCGRFDLDIFETCSSAESTLRTSA